MSVGLSLLQTYLTPPLVPLTLPPAFLGVADGLCTWLSEMAITLHHPSPTVPIPGLWNHEAVGLLDVVLSCGSQSQTFAEGCFVPVPLSLCSWRH